MLPRNERRQFTRFRPKDGTIAVNHHALGPVINISMGGFSFRYMGETPAEQIPDVLSIFLGSDDVLIEEISTKIVSDRLVSLGSAFLKTSTRQRSIQFTDLTISQRENLEEFISSNTLGMYSPPHS
jgi:hypothetical protein